MEIQPEKKPEKIFEGNTEDDKNDNEIQLPGSHKNPNKNDPYRPVVSKKDAGNQKRSYLKKAVNDSISSKLQKEDSGETIRDNKAVERGQSKKSRISDKTSSETSSKNIYSSDSFLSIKDIDEKNNTPIFYTDEQLAQEVRNAVLREKSVSENSKHINVTVHNGIVTLEGEIISDQEKMTLGDKAAAFAGFGKVVNNLIVRGI